MSGGGGGGGFQQTNSNTNSNSIAGPNPEIAGKLQNLVGNAWGYIGQNMNAPGYFPGGTLAPETESSRLAINNLLARGMDTGQGGLGTAAKGMTLDTLSGKYLDPASNPAYQGWLEASFRPQAEQFRDIIAPSIDSTFAGSGRTGGGAHFDTSMRGYQDLARAQSDAAAKAGLGMYQGERANQFQAAGLLPTYQNMDYQNLGAIQQAGAMDQGRAQQVLDAENARYGYDQTAQLDWYNRLAQSLQGMYPGAQTTGQQSGSSWGMAQQPQQGGGVGSFLGPALSIAGTAAKFLPFSDVRLKDVHARVGFTDDGLPLYLWNYKGDERPQIGPMAQDVEKVKPEAVFDDPSGFKRVDYAQLAPGGLM